MMNAISQLQLKSCNVLKGCLLLDLQCMREFVCNADRYVGAGINRSSSTNICLCCIIAILTLKDTKDCHDNKMFAASVHKILEIATMQIDDAARIARENEPFNMRGVSLMSLIAINMAIYRRVPPLESCANLFKALLSFVQACIIRFTKRGDHSETIMFRISLVTALDLIQAPAAVNKNTISYIGVINDIIQFCSVEANNDFLEPEVKENAMKLASCLVKLRCDNAASKVVLNGEFLVDWSLQTLSKVNSGCSECSNAMSALFIQFSLEVLDLAFLKAPTQSKRCDAEITKLFENVLRIGIITKLIWLLLHPDNVIQYLDRKVLSKLTGLIRSRRQQEKQGFVHTYIDDRNVAKLLLQQSVVQVSLYVKESIQNDSQGCQLLEQMTRGIYDIVISGDADSVIDQCTVALSPEATIISCTGLLLIASSPSRVESQELAFYSNDFVKELIKAVFDVSMSTRFEFVEISAVFWQAIEFIIARRENTEQEGTSIQDILTLGSREEPLFRAGMETTVIMFRSLIDDVETPMECPSLAELVQRVPGLAQEIERQLLVNHKGLEQSPPVIHGISYTALEKLMNDASCYEPQSQQQLVDDFPFTGEDILTIDECLELLYLAHTYSAPELKKKYSMLCALKLDPDCSIRVFDGAVRSEDIELALIVFRLFRERWNVLLVNDNERDSLPKIIAAMLELAYYKIR